MTVLVSQLEDRIGFMANEAVKTLMSQLISTADTRRRGEGAKALAGGLGGAVETAWEFSGMAPDQFRKFLTENIAAYCDHIDPPPAVADEEKTGE